MITRLALGVALGIAILTTSTAHAAGPEFDSLIGKLIPGRCHMNYCSWARIEQADLVGSNEKGQLYALNMKGWGAEYPDGNYNRPARKVGGESSTSYVFCSKQTPAWIDKDQDGTWRVTRLQPGNSAAMFGAVETTYAMYWGACHHAIVKNVYDGGDRLGKRLGYHFHGSMDDVSETFSVKSPLDVLKGGRL